MTDDELTVVFECPEEGCSGEVPFPAGLADRKQRRLLSHCSTCHRPFVLFAGEIRRATRSDAPGR